MIYFVRNDPEVLPASYGLWVEQMGLPQAIVRLDAGDRLPRLAAGDAAIILGGRMSADDTTAHPYLGPLVDWLRDNAVRGLPQLGICLGGQLLAMALGGRLHRERHQELGVTVIELTTPGTTDALFSGVDTSLTSFSWHSDSFDPPPGAVRLARSDACPEQAFRWRQSWGLQFHPEADEATVAGWTGLATAAGELDAATAATVLGNLTAAYPEHVRSGRLILTNFLAEATAAVTTVKAAKDLTEATADTSAPPDSTTSGERRDH